MWGRLRRLKNNMYKKLIRFISQKIKSYSGRIRAKHFCNKYKHQGLNVKVGIGCWFGKNITADFIDGSGCLTIGDNIIIDGSTKFIISNNGDINIGANSNIRENSLFEVTNFGHIAIGENCFFNKNATIVSMNSIEIGNDTIFGPNVMVYDHDHDYRQIKEDKYVCAPIIIGNNCWIAANALLLKETNIGDNAVVAGSTIVNGCVEQQSLFYNPVQKKQKRIDYGK